MEQTSNGNAPFLLIQKPQELIRLFENLIDQKIKEIICQVPSKEPVYFPEDSPFLSSREVQQIFRVSRQTINDWRRSELLPSFKIKSRRFFFKEHVEQLRRQLPKGAPGIAPKEIKARTQKSA
ncbi:MAG TPA: helix-turn-helix domain-containing protein [Flavisolibacter sp.]|nr:helix-turn-helix domain-containing protein [Flavisolibacter sp.]